MIIYRLVRTTFKDDLTGQGAYLYGGRWNSNGKYAIYCTEHISLAILEIVVNTERNTAPILPSYHLLEFSISENDIYEIDRTILKKKWRGDLEYTRFIGDQFLQSKSKMVLKIPSAVVPEENNFLLNPSAENFHKLKIQKSTPYNLDKRLF